ncbi:hypothetical protein [Vibrio diabolicus]|uniref:hypothetical protein n=1 Tax=Vibrio TaxID=662 RepID=UPI0035A93C1D
MKTKILLVIATVALITGCVQMPTTKSIAVDNRPQLTFKNTTNNSPNDYSIFIDGLDNGSIAPFSNGTKALRVLPGTHLIEIYKGDKLISSQKIYVGDGVTKEVIVE